MQQAHQCALWEYRKYHLATSKHWVCTVCFEPQNWSFPLDPQELILNVQWKIVILLSVHVCTINFTWPILVTKMWPCYLQKGQQLVRMGSHACHFCQHTFPDNFWTKVTAKCSHKFLVPNYYLCLNAKNSISWDPLLNWNFTPSQKFRFLMGPLWRPKSFIVKIRTSLSWFLKKLNELSERSNYPLPY